MPNAGDRSENLAGVRRWLVVLYLLVLAMVIIGGVTRLSGSGLSMVNWRPLMGTVPPLNDAEWTEVFTQYQASPEGRLVNAGVSLADFKAIFFWEYLHRLVGRLIGVVFALPFFYFVARRRMSRALMVRTGIAFALGGAQGLLGWYMVKSGLVDVPHVSHFRLAAHLLLAFGTAQWILWIILGLPSERREDAVVGPASRAFRWATVGFITLLTLQILYGAFMAGTHAGAVSATFPDMNGSYGPGPFFTAPTLWDDFIHHGPAIHYLHRGLGWLALFVGAALWLAARRRDEPEASTRAALGALVVLGVQFTLGALTVVLHVSLWIAVVHQVGAFVALSAATVLAYRAWAPRLS